MAKNLHGRKVVYNGDCDKCCDRGYTWISSKHGMMTFCDCKNGVALEEKMRVARETLRTCRKLSRDGVSTPVRIAR